MIAAETIPELLPIDAPQAGRSERVLTLLSTGDPGAPRRLLLISHHFPPVGGAGVQRPVKFVKYLREFGWDVSVLTAANPSVPVFDRSLSADLPDDLVVERAPTWEPGYRLKQAVARESTGGNPGGFVRLKKWGRGAVRNLAGVLLQPDPQVLWLPNALRAAQRLLKQTPHDAILATAPPYSSLILGALLKRHSGLPLILDYRDEWDLSSQYLENRQRDWISRVVQEGLQRRVIRQADAIVATTAASTARLQERVARARSRATTTCIYNGFDATDFPDEISADHDIAFPRGADRRFRLVYTGTLWNLTTVEPLVKAIERIHRQTPEVLDGLELVFVGRKTPSQQELLERLRVTRCLLQSEDYCEHERVLELMRGADGLCLLLSDVPGAERVAPAKLFEYLAARRPMLAIVPEGETAEIVRRFHPQGQIPPRNVGSIADWLCDRVIQHQWAADEDLPADLSYDIDGFSRRRQAGELAELLSRVVAEHSQGDRT